jgi:lysozyme family protein
MNAEQIIANTIGIEGKYSNDPSDAGGETMWGITVATARQHGYTGPMRDLPRDTAVGIYKQNYFNTIGIDKVLNIYERVAAEVFDTGVNMGPKQAIIFLQVALNVLNQQGKQYQDITVDGSIGPRTLSSLEAYKSKRGAEGETVLLKVLNCLQGSHYIELATSRVKDEDFIYGWFRERVGL